MGYLKSFIGSQHGKQLPARRSNVRSFDGSLTGMANPAQWLLKILGGHGLLSSANIEIADHVALSNTTVFACIKLISETMANLPLNLYEHTERGGKRIAREHPYYDLLHHEPNKDQIPFVFKQMLVGHNGMRGNALAYLSRGRNDRVLEMIPIHPDKIKPERSSGGGPLIYRYSGFNGPSEIPARDIFHVPLFTTDGLWGMSPIQNAVNAIGLAVAAEQYGSKLFAQGATPPSYIKHPLTLSKIAKDNIRDTIKDVHSGLENVGNIPILEENMEWMKLGFSPEDAQTLELRGFQVRDICRAYGVPSPLIGDYENSPYATIEAVNIHFVIYCILSYVRRYEQTYNRKLLSKDDREKYCVGFNLDGLLRGDNLSRMQAYAVGRQWGFLSINDIRAKEDWELIGPEGDVYLEPLNMVPAGFDRNLIYLKNKQEGQSDPKNQKQQPEADPEALRTQMRSTLATWMTENTKRLFRKHANILEKKGSIDYDVFKRDVMDELGPAISTAISALGGEDALRDVSSMQIAQKFSENVRTIHERFPKDDVVHHLRQDSHSREAALDLITTIEAA